MAAPFDSKTDATTEGTTVTKGVTSFKLKDCEGQKDGTLLGDHHDPEIFYECLNHGKAFKFHCPKGLIFVEKEKSCGFDPDHPNLITHAPSHNSKFDCTGKKDGMYIDPKDPTKFHQCASGTTYDFNCPPQTMFDEEKQVCAYDEDWKERTHAPTEPNTTTTQEPTTQEGTTHESTTKDGH